MKLVIDGGSTKADWTALTLDGTILFTTQTQGLNPEVLTKQEIVKRINKNSYLVKNKEQVSHLFFYGAGCGTDRMKFFLKEVLQSYFTKAKITVQEDTYAAIYATTPPNHQAIVCILGTGSNCSYFDGEKVHQKIESLGYIIMDDCSGNKFGKHLLRGYYYNKMPKKLQQQFETTYNTDPDFIKNKLYKEANPNAYLAKFAPFLIQNKTTDFCKTIIYNEITLFIENHIKQYTNYTQIPIHFVGSIAYYLKDELQELLHQNNITLGTVLKRPIDGLIAYHIN